MEGVRRQFKDGLPDDETMENLEPELHSKDLEPQLPLKELDTQLPLTEFEKQLAMKELEPQQHMDKKEHNSPTNVPERHYTRCQLKSCVGA